MMQIEKGRTRSTSNKMKKSLPTSKEKIGLRKWRLLFLALNLTPLKAFLAVTDESG